MFMGDEEEKKYIHPQFFRRVLKTEKMPHDRTPHVQAVQQAENCLPEQTATRIGLALQPWASPGAPCPARHAPARPRSRPAYRVDEAAALLSRLSRSRQTKRKRRGEKHPTRSSSSQGTEKSQRGCTVWRAVKKEAKQFWHKLPALRQCSQHSSR